MKSDKKLIIEPTDDRRRRKARDEFRSLLDSDTAERHWQMFFDRNPFIFSDTFSIKFDGLYRQVPLNSGRPDYVFIRNFGNRLTGDYGVIELKRPDDAIIGTYSSKFIVQSKALRPVAVIKAG